jgi:hypothetical protein
VSLFAVLVCDLGGRLMIVEVGCQYPATDNLEAIRSDGDMHRSEIIGR